MSKLGLLLKVQWHETMRGGYSRSSQYDSEPDTGKKRKKRRSAAGYTVMLVVSAVMMVAIISVMLVGIGFVAHSMGYDSMLIIIGMAGASIFSLVTSIYNTHGLLFGYKDYEMTTALPFATSTIVACRLLILYFWNLIFCAAIMLPAGIIYACFAHPTWVFWPLYIIGLLLTPLLPTVIATIIGGLIALVATRFKRRGIMGTIFTLVFLMLYMVFILNMDTIIESFADVAPTIMRLMTQIWPPSAWFAQGVCEYSTGMYVLFVGVSAGVFAVYCMIVGKCFVRINSALSASHTKSDFRMTAQRAVSVKKALLRKEAKRLVGSSNYMMNTCIGAIMTVFFSVVLLFIGPEHLFSSLVSDADAAAEIGEARDIGLMIAMFLGFFMTIGSTTSVSISMEGNTFWLVKTLPVSSWDILRAKQNLNLLIGGAASVISGVCFCIAFPGQPFMWPLYFLVPFSYCTFITMFGQLMNLKYPDLTWTSEVKVLKQGKSVMVCTFAGLGFGMVPFILTIVFGTIVPIITCAVLYVLTFVLYRKLKTKGIAEFDAIAA